ncbi:MAG: hotdog fold thioesterase [Capnocytophaga sp.]|nr:hotdog fold thioesterase [Capnocytophaga sp.]
MTNTEKQAILERCNATSKGNLMEHLQIKYTDIGDQYMSAQMPVTKAHTQPDGVLHGGASIALAETLGSIAAFVFFCQDGGSIRGVELSANHVRSAKIGETVTATATCLHSGRTLQVWEIKITNEEQKLISFCKFTTMKI